VSGLVVGLLGCSPRRRGRPRLDVRLERSLVHDEPGRVVAPSEHELPEPCRVGQVDERKRVLANGRLRNVVGA
jgi:hypothetical protein